MTNIVPQLTVTVSSSWKIGAESTVHSRLHYANSLQSSWHPCCWQGTRPFAVCILQYVIHPVIAGHFKILEIVALLGGTFNHFFLPTFLQFPYYTSYPSSVSMLTAGSPLPHWGCGESIAASQWKPQNLTRKIKEDLNKGRKRSIHVWNSQ